MTKHKQLSYLAVGTLLIWLNMDLFDFPVPLTTLIGLILFLLVYLDYRKSNVVNKDFNIAFFIFLGCFFGVTLYSVINRFIVNGFVINIESIAKSFNGNLTQEEALAATKELVETIKPHINYTIVVLCITLLFSLVRPLGFYFLGRSYIHYADDRLPQSNTSLAKDTHKQGKKYLIYSIVVNALAIIISIVSLLMVKNLQFDENNMPVATSSVYTSSILVLILGIALLVFGIMTLIAIIKFLIYIFRFRVDYMNGDINEQPSNDSEGTSVPYESNEEPSTEQETESESSELSEEKEEDNINRYRYEEDE